MYVLCVCVCVCACVCCVVCCVVCVVYIEVLTGLTNDLNLDGAIAALPNMLEGLHSILQGIRVRDQRLDINSARRQHLDGSAISLIKSHENESTWKCPFFF